MDGILASKRKRDNLFHDAALKMQCLVRTKLAVNRMYAETRFWALKAKFAVVVQRFYRWRNTTFQVSALSGGS